MSELWDMLRSESGEMLDGIYYISRIFPVSLYYSLSLDQVGSWFNSVGIGHDWNHWTSDGSFYAKNDYPTTIEDSFDINNSYYAQGPGQQEKTTTRPKNTRSLSLESTTTPASTSATTRHDNNEKPAKRTQSSEVSARFRQRRKEKQLKMMEEVKQAEEEVNKLQSEARILSHENKVLRDLLSLRKDN
jgi:hypothetical protein